MATSRVSAREAHRKIDEYDARRYDSHYLIDLKHLYQLCKIMIFKVRLIDIKCCYIAIFKFYAMNCIHPNVATILVNEMSTSL